MPQVEAPADETKVDQGARDESKQEGAEATEDKSEQDDKSDKGATAPKDDDASGKGETEDKSAGKDKAQTDDDSTRKSQNRAGFQMRQVRGRDPYVAELRTNLQDNWVNEEGLTDEQRAIRRIEADSYVKDVETQRSQLVADNVAVANEIPIFNPESDEFNKALYDHALERFGRDSLKLDKQGKIIGYGISLLDYMREEADAYYAGVEAGKGKTATHEATDDKDDKKSDAAAAHARMDAASEDAGGTSPTRSEGQSNNKMLDDFLSGFDSVK